MGLRKRALNEVLPSVYYRDHLLPEDRAPLRSLVRVLGAGLAMSRMPSGIYVVGSSTWTEQMCDETGWEFPRAYNDIDLRVAPIGATTLPKLERAILEIFEGTNFPTEVDREPKMLPERPSGYVPVDYRARVKTALTNGRPVDLIIRPSRRALYVKSWSTTLNEERNYDPKEKCPAFSILYRP